MTLMSPDYLDQGLYELLKQGCKIIAVVPYEYENTTPLRVRYYQIVYTQNTVISGGTS